MSALRVLLFTSMFSLSFAFLQAQGNESESVKLDQALEQIEEKFRIQVFYRASDMPDRNISIASISEDLDVSLTQLLKNTSLGYLQYSARTYIVAPKNLLERNYDATYFQRSAESDAVASTEIELEELEVGSADSETNQGIASVQGFITDDATKDPLIGATLYIEEAQVGTTTDEIGKFTLDLPVGVYTVTINSVGYVENKVRWKVLGEGFVDMALSQEAVRLGEVVISSEALNENISRTEVGLEILDVAEIKKLPSFLGEADVMKSLLLLPGVSSVGEGSGGINVRGGTVDQDLIMQDGMYLFNTSHVLGLFSLFNPDLVKNVNLYRGSMPARYGGRLSSVLDVDLKEGSYQQFAANGGVGLISSRLTVESPIKKGQSSIIIGSRLSFSDYMFDLIDVANLKESTAFFYDGNAKFTQRIGNKGKFSLGGYLSQDRFKFDDEFDFKWRTEGVSTNFNYLLSDDLSVNMEGLWSKYSSQWVEPESNRAFQLDNDIEFVKFRPELIYSLSASQNLNLGVEVNFYKVNPGEIMPTTATSVTIPENIPTEKARDFSFYINDDVELGDAISVSLGLRYTIFQNVGPATVDIYEPNAPRIPATITGSEQFGDGEVFNTYTGLEPRFSFNYGINDQSSIKLSYNRTQQFINQISNTTAVSPVDIWQLSNTHIPPVRAHNYSLGYFRNFKDNLWESSLEVFYRDISNLIEFKDLADLLINPLLETALVAGQGRAYGAELSIEKTQGRWSGRLGYTFSRTQRRTESEFQEDIINNNEWFASNFDRPHDLSLVLSYQSNQRNSLAINFVYSSGRPVTAPVGSFSNDNIFNIPIYSDRNTFRIPAYHRLDISYTIGRSHRKTKDWKGSWTFSIFNVYARRNPFSVFFTQQPFQSPKANRLSVLGSMIPSVTYNFSF